MDDTDIFSESSKTSLQAFVHTLKEFYSNMGLKVNFDKSIVFSTSLELNIVKQIELNVPLSWPHEKLNVLGIMVAGVHIMAKNYDPVLKKAEVVIRVSCH